MELTNEFVVAVPIEQAWALLLDIERLGPCMPGAEVTSFDGESFTGTVKVKLGPVNQTYGGKGRFVSRDPEAYTVVVEASGKDKRGSGTAAATVRGSLHPADGGTRVHVVTELHITGPAAQFGRGMIAEVAGKLIGQFAACLADELATSAPAAELATPAAETGRPPVHVETGPPPVHAAQPLAETVPQAASGTGPATAQAATAAPMAAEPTAAEPVTAEPAASATVPAQPTVGAEPPAPATAANRPKREVQPIDLLEVTGAKRNFLPYAVVFLVGAVVGAIVMALIR